MGWFAQIVQRGGYLVVIGHRSKAARPGNAGVGSGFLAVGFHGKIKAP